MELRRLRGLSPATARQLFASTVAPVVDYASNVWMHACKDKAMGPINRVQRVGAQAIVGTFLTVATSVAEAEAHMATAQRRFWKRAVKMWTDVHTLPETNPLRRCTDQIRKFRRYHRSPLYHVADLESTRPTQISVRADKLRRLWSTSSFDVGSGPHTGRRCYNVPTLTEEICPFTWEGSPLPTIKSGRQT
jgi:hypothetical protein